jgi:hypothetical protein
VLLESERDVREKLKLVPRVRSAGPRPTQRKTLEAVVNHIVAILEKEG